MCFFLIVPVQATVDDAVDFVKMGFYEYLELTRKVTDPLLPIRPFLDFMHELTKEAENPATAYNEYVNQRNSPTYSPNDSYLRAQDSVSYLSSPGSHYENPGVYDFYLKHTAYTYVFSGHTNSYWRDYGVVSGQYTFTPKVTGAYYLTTNRLPVFNGSSPSFYFYVGDSNTAKTYALRTSQFLYTDVSTQPVDVEDLAHSRPVRMKTGLLLNAGVTYRFSFPQNRFDVKALGYREDGTPFRVESAPYKMVLEEPDPDDNAPSTRVGILNGDYISEGGTKYNDVYIVNETDNTVYNPVTGDTYNISEWNYDYSTRTYNITVDNSQTVNITYGDEYVTIQEGDTITNIYYGGGGGGGGDTPTDPASCSHKYTSVTTQEPACTTPGQQKNTCSLCQKSTVEQISAKGHSWVVERTVQTTYDDAGVLLQKGYTLYKCAACNEQYKDESGAGPPGAGGGSGSEDGKDSIWDKLGKLLGGAGDIFITVIKATIGKLLDSLVALVDMINQKIESVVTSILGLFDRIPQFFGGFMGFLTAVFPFLPQEIFDILILTVALVCLAFIIKFVFKR